MKALFVANLELMPTEGIYKKVCAQADAIGNAIGECELITRKGKNAILKEYLVNQPRELSIEFYKVVLDKIRNSNIELIYIRHMIPSHKLINVLKCAKKQGVKIYYEIPTYPYFGEQYKTSRRKYRAVIKIIIDIIFWPIIYAYIDKLVVIRSNSKSNHYKKMVEITNGVKTEDIEEKEYNNNSTDVFSMVTVGTLYPYHGYDRVLKGLAECNEMVGDNTIEFHIVGSSQTIDELHSMANQLNLKHVYFHGTKSTEELNEMYKMFDVGLGCLALHRRNADIDTTLKVIEYYCRGIPVVTSGKCPSSNVSDYTIFVDDTEEPINISNIFRDYKKIDINKKREISGRARELFSWDFIMTNLIRR